VSEKDYFQLIIAIVVIGLAILLIGLAWNPLMLGMGMGMMGFGWGSMFLIPLAFLVLIAVGAYYLIIELTRSSKSTTNKRIKPLVILNERYAKGEITREQYVKMKGELGL
jgi:putative membrane protein